jgi:hypothetical protein
MTEFSFPRTWYNIDSEQYLKMSVYSPRPLDDKLIDVGELRMYLPEGHYESAQELFETIKTVWLKYWNRVKKDIANSRVTALPPDKKTKVPRGTDLTHVQRLTQVREDEEEAPSIDFDSLRVYFDEKTHKIKFDVFRWAHQLTFSPELHDILAMPKERDRTDWSYASQTEVDVNRGTHTIFVYCDVVQDSIVGDVKAPLLRSVIANARYGEDKREVFSKPMYMPLRTNQFDTIRISIKDESGRPIKFNYGNSCVTLHFRRVGKTII